MKGDSYVKLKNPHDLFFKETFGNVTTASNFLSNYLPPSLIEQIDLHTLEPQKDHFIEEQLKESFSDLLFKTTIAGNEGYIYFLFEHKSYPDKGTVFQVLKYMIQIWQAKLDQEYGELPVVIPLVIYHGKSNWHIPDTLAGILKGYHDLPTNIKIYIPNFTYLLYDLSKYSDEEIKGAVLTRITLTLLRDIFTTDPEKLIDSILRSVEFLQDIEDKQTGIQYFETMLYYIIGSKTNLSKDDVQELIGKIEHIFPEGSEITMSIAEIWKEKGREEGRHLNLIEMTTKTLLVKFKDVPTEISEKIEQSDPDTLEGIVLKLINDEFKNIDEVRDFL